MDGRCFLSCAKRFYEDFLRQRELVLLKPNSPILQRFKQRKPQTVEEFAAWVSGGRKKNTDNQGRPRTNRDSSKDNLSVPVGEGPCESLSSACLSANGALSLLNLSCYLLDRQVERLAQDFENEGGFTERLCRVRSQKRKKQL
jgi:four helix bundle suffix protein